MVRLELDTHLVEIIMDTLFTIVIINDKDL